MGARQSKRSVDITTTPKKEGMPAEGGVVGDAAAPGDGKLERIEEADTKPTTNGIAPHTDAAEDKEKDKDEATEKDNEPQEDVKDEEAKQESIGESAAEVAEVTTPTEATPASPNAVASPDSKETKKKDKKKKWSFRSISFSKKDKTKPNREETRKNGDVSMDGNMSVQEPLAEGGEETESATAATSSPMEEKSSASSPSADEQVAAAPAAAVATTESKDEAAAASPTTVASPAEEKKEEPTPLALTPVPSAEDKKEEAVEKIEAAEKKVVEVSPAGDRSVTGLIRVPIFRVQPVAKPSIIERKASEDLPSLLPSSPPPTPVDSSPLQQARQAAASATALAEALKLPAEAANKKDSTAVQLNALPSSCEDVSQNSRVGLSPTSASTSLKSPGLLADPSSPTETTFVPARVECPSMTEIEIESRDVASKGEALVSNRDNKGVEIDPKIESASENPVAMEEISKHQQDETQLTTDNDTTKQLDFESLDNTQNEIVMNKVECSVIPKEINSPISDSVKEVCTCEDLSANESEVKDSENKLLDQLPTDYGNEKIRVESLSMITPQMDVLNDVTKHEVMNEILLGAECQIKSEINNCEGAMKTNALAKTGHNEEAEAGTSTEIEINSSRTTIKQHFSSENFGTKKISFSGEMKDVLKKEIIASAISSMQTEPVSTVSEIFINSEEGPLPVSNVNDVLVKAKLAMVVSEDDSVKELTDTIEFIKVIPEIDEETIENEPDIVLPMEKTPISEKLENMSVSGDAPVVVEPCELNDTKAVCIDTLPPPPLEDTVMLNSQIPELANTMDIFRTEPIAIDLNPVVYPATIAAKQITTPFSQIEQVERSENSFNAALPECHPSYDKKSPFECFIPTYSLHNEDSKISNSNYCTPEVQDVPVDDLPPLIQLDQVAIPEDPTETLLTPPVSPNSQSNVRITSDIAAITKDNSHTLLYNEDDRSNHESAKPISPRESTSYIHSDVELKERLATECLAKTECQERALSVELSSIDLSIAVQKHHQNIPETETPVENNVAHETSTTESIDEAPKVAPPVVPNEAPASPPTAPAITEDVASVTKAIEEIDISDKAVAAAVNECNTNEIIADAHHQNNIDDYE